VKILEPDFLVRIASSSHAVRAVAWFISADLGIRSTIHGLNGSSSRAVPRASCSDPQGLALFAECLGCINFRVADTGIECFTTAVLLAPIWGVYLSRPPTGAYDRADDMAALLDVPSERGRRCRDDLARYTSRGS